MADKTLRLTVGGLGGAVTVTGSGDELAWVEHRDASEDRRTVLHPSPEAWTEFWRVLDELDVWNWQPEYGGGITQIYCAAVLESGRRRVAVRAKDEVPPGWEEVCLAVSRLAQRYLPAFFEPIVEVAIRGNRCRIVWWDWKAHVPFEELRRAEEDGLVWMRMVPDTHSDEYALVCSAEPTSLDDAAEAWVVGWEQGYDPEEDATSTALYERLSAP